MSQAFTVMWTNDRCDRLLTNGEEGKPLTVLFGGIHSSAPSLKRAGVMAGDVVFPVFVRKGALHVVAGAVIKEFIELTEYVAQDYGLAREDLGNGKRGRLVGPLGHRTPYGCGTEVALVGRSTPMNFGVTIPPACLGSITFCPRRGRPATLRRIVDGKLKSTVSLYGHVRRLCAETAMLLSELVGLREEAG